MPLEVTSRATLDVTVVEGDLASMVNDLNIASAQGKQYVIMEEIRGGAEYSVALDIRNITRIRDLGSDEHFVRSS